MIIMFVCVITNSPLAFLSESVCVRGWAIECVGCGSRGKHADCQIGSHVVEDLFWLIYNWLEAQLYKALGVSFPNLFRPKARRLTDKCSFNDI